MLPKESAVCPHSELAGAAGPPPKTGTGGRGLLLKGGVAGDGPWGGPLGRGVVGTTAIGE